MSAANVKGDRRAVQRAMEAIMSESRRGGQARLPGLDRPPATTDLSGRAAGLPERIAELVFEMPLGRRLADLVLPKDLVGEVEELMFEYANAGVLRRHSLEPRHTVLLLGPPGNGKTSLAEAIATELALPLLSVRYDALVDSYLGETSLRLRRLLDYAGNTPCVLFFDEFEAVGKERGDAQETGEIKRVVSSLLMQMDRLPSHSLVICATNHPELLDRAIWRRFEVQLHIEPPGPEELKLWFARFARSIDCADLGLTAEQFADALCGSSMAAVEAFTLDVRRKLILSGGTLTAAQAVGEELKRLRKRTARLGHQKSRVNNGQQLSDRPAPTRARKG